MATDIVMNVQLLIGIVIIRLAKTGTIVPQLLSPSMVKTFSDEVKGMELLTKKRSESTDDI